MEGILSLLKSRKFWLSVFGVVQVLVFHFLNVPDEIWQAIAALVAVLISAIAVEEPYGGIFTISGDYVRAIT